MIFFVTKSLLVRYGRTAMIFCESASPIPGSACNPSLVAELMSTSFAFLSVAAFSDFAGADMVFDCATAPRPLLIATLKTRIKTASNKFLRMTSPRLSVNSALPDRIGHAVNRQHVSRDPVVHSMRLGVADHILESVHHDVFQLLIDH